MTRAKPEQLSTARLFDFSKKICYSEIVLLADNTPNLYSGKKETHHQESKEILEEIDSNEKKHESSLSGIKKLL